jgi:hypothetical protein
MFNAENIPEELKLRNQWVCSEADGIPLNPNFDGVKADPMNPETWGTFEQARTSGKPHIGFVLHRDDPYCIIDLDDKEHNPATPEQLERFGQIVNSFDSYVEISKSGRGVHIVVKGFVESGVKRDNVEIYSWGRYMIFTGNVVKDLPIADYSKAVIEMHSGMKSVYGEIELEWLPDEITDLEVYQMGMGAVNGDKFNALWQGLWQDRDEYRTEGQSAADHALLAMLCFYSQSNEQVIRLFRSSGLGQRQKAQRDEYLFYSLRKIRSNLAIPQVDFSNLKFPVEISTVEPVQEEIATIQPELSGDESLPFDFPAGLVGEIASYVYSSSIRPVPHVSLAAGLSLLAGIVGRCFNISDSGLNHYIILVAGTGRGKEDAARGIDRLMSAVRLTVPTADRFEGPASFASGQGLIRFLDSSPCFVSVMGEIGITLQQIARKDASPADVAFRKALLNLYSKSGFTNSLKPSAYSDKEKNTKLIQAPNVTILGEGSTSTFYSGLDIDNVADGLIPRFSIIDYKGKRVKRNPNAFGLPPAALVDKLQTVCAMALASEQNNQCQQLGYTQKGLEILDSFDTYCDNSINTAKDRAIAELWNRGHLKSLKLAGLLAVGVDPTNPIITEELAEWSVTFTKWEIGGIVSKFNSGEFGQGDHRQEEDLRRIIQDYYKMEPRDRRGYNVSHKLAELGNVYPLAYLKKRLRLLSSFKNDRRGPHAAIDSLIKGLCNDATLARVPADQALAEFETRAAIYTCGDSWG